MAVKKKKRQLKNDCDLVLDEKNRDHDRRQSLKDTATKICRCSIIILVCIFFVVSVIFLVRLFIINDWDKIEYLIRTGWNYVIGGILGILIKNKVIPSNNQ